MLNKLNKLAIAIWYMDDGCLSAKRRKGKINAWQLLINTYISKEDNQVIIDYFKETWDIQFNLNKHRDLYRLRCGTKEARKFIKIVKPYIYDKIKCMEYKVKDI